MFIPIFMKIHPDRYAQHEDHVKAANLACIQSINEFWSSYETLLNLLKSNAGLAPSNTLKKQYDFTCFHMIDADTHVDGKDQGQAKVDKVPFILKVPHLLCDVEILNNNRKEAQNKLRTLPKNLVELFISLRLDDPFAEPRAASSVQSDASLSEAQRKEAERISFSDSIWRMADTRAFEHDIELMSRSLNTTLFEQNVEPTDVQKAYMAADVDVYMQLGLVYVKHMSAEEEVRALQKLRDFLTDCGWLVCFDSNNWRRVVFVINAQLNAISRKKPRCRYTLKDGFHVLEIPSKFRIKEVLNLLHTNVPESIVL
jgi:hypothetical protein